MKFQEALNEVFDTSYDIDWSSGHSFLFRFNVDDNIREMKVDFDAQHMEFFGDMFGLLYDPNSDGVVKSVYPGDKKFYNEMDKLRIIDDIKIKEFIIDVTFKVLGKQDWSLTGSFKKDPKGLFKIMGTIVKIVKEYFSEGKGKVHNSFMFSADIKEKGRVKLYDRFAKMIEAHGWQSVSGLSETKKNKLYFFKRK